MNLRALEAACGPPRTSASTENASIRNGVPVITLTVARFVRYRPETDLPVPPGRRGLLSDPERWAMTDRQIAPLLDLDPDLGLMLGEDRVDAARHELRVAVHALDAGPWDAGKLASASPGHVGMLVLDGVIAREVLVSDTVSTELLGPGDVVRPWRLHDSSALLRHQVRFSVLTRTRFALLDRRFGVELTRYPEVMVAVVDRVNERALRLAVTQAISQLNRVDRRLLALFWHLAERWGRMTAEGVALPLTLSHRMLGQLIGARRPTVSTALGELAKQGELARRDDGTWLLTGAPVGVPEPEIERMIPMRRRLLPAEAPAPVETAVDAPGVAIAAPEQLAPVHVRGVELRAVLERMRQQHEEQLAEMRDAIERTTQLTARGNELRESFQRTRGNGHTRRPVRHAD
jgi:CRP/FNR family transcriptional regulator, cyclic AMP receptor protein